MASAFSRIASFARRDHRYVLLGTSAIAAIGMMLSSQPRSPMSFLAHAFTVELVMYYLLVAWIVLSAVALVFKFTHWKTYAQTAPFTKPDVVRALRLGSYVIWAMVAILVVDRVVLGFASAWAAAANATSMPKDIAGVVTTIELAVFGTVIAFFLAILLVAIRIMEIDRSDNDFTRFLKKVGVGFAKFYSTIVRGTPMLVQGVIIYYLGIAVVSSFGFSITEVNNIWSRFTAGLVVVSLNRLHDGSTARWHRVGRHGSDGSSALAWPFAMAGNDQGRLPSGH